MPEPDEDRATKACETGIQFLASGNLPLAARAFASAAETAPESQVYKLYLAWTLFRAQPKKEADRVAPLRALAERALEEDEDSALAHYVIGQMALREGDYTMSNKWIGRANELDPRLNEWVQVDEVKDPEASAAPTTPSAEPFDPSIGTEASLELKRTGRLVFPNEQDSVPAIPVVVPPAKVVHEKALARALELARGQSGAAGGKTVRLDPNASAKRPRVAASTTARTRGPAPARRPEPFRRDIAGSLVAIGIGVGLGLALVGVVTLILLR